MYCLENVRFFISKGMGSTLDPAAKLRILRSAKLEAAGQEGIITEDNTSSIFTESGVRSEFEDELRSNPGQISIRKKLESLRV